MSRAIARNDSHETLKQYGERVMKQWEEALNDEGGIGNHHLAMQTAILLDTYWDHLTANPELIAEDEITTSNFRGVNLALLGLIRRVIPALVGADLVGLQAMPTPKSPIFYLVWQKAIDLLAVASGKKGSSSNGDELFGYPAQSSQSLTQADAYFSSNQVRELDLTAATAVPGPTTAAALIPGISLEWYPVINSTVVVRVYAVDSNSNGATVEIARAQAQGVYSGSAVPFVQVSGLANFFATPSSVYNSGARTLTLGTGAYTLPSNYSALTWGASWEYVQEGNANAPQMTANILELSVPLIRRMLKGKFSIDSVQDAKAYHGISLENEMMEMMRIELMNEINREIIKDLRTMAAIRYTADWSAATANNTAYNYDDTHKYILDVTNSICAEIMNQGRLGYGNWALGNPTTLAFLERVPGFQGSGVNADAKGLSFMGSLGGRISFYRDPQYPKNELLIGYKGSSALDTGYIHAPYMPITATPTMLDPDTGDSRKIFFTRYGKTFDAIDPATGLTRNAIYRGEWNYAVLQLINFPQIVGSLT